MAATAGRRGAVAEKPSSGQTSLFLHLPSETQQEIISHCSQADLICVALVCKRFHELASAQLYRNFHIVFPDDDDINFDSPIDGLAGGLDTFTTSDSDYAQYLRDLSMDTLSAGSKGEKSYQPYLYTASCGKFLNSLLHLTLRKATSLETFRWNIRVELSRPVYRELHRIQSLTKLHVRMQNGNSYYNPPPPLPASLDTQSSSSAGDWPTLMPSVPLLPPPPPPMGMSPPPPVGPPLALLPPSKSASKGKNCKGGLSGAEPSTFSGFKNLKALSVLDIESLDVIPEIRACVKNSFSTLKELQLSLSDGLAQQSRKPPPDSDVDDSDLDDEFQVVSAQSVSSSGPAKAFRAQEERKLHDGILGKIFDIEQTLVKRSPSQRRARDSTWCRAQSNEAGAESPPAQSTRERFISSLKQAATRLLALQSGSRDVLASQQDVLDILEKAARKYVDSCDHPSAPDTTEGTSDNVAEPHKLETDAAQQGYQSPGAEDGAEDETACPESAADDELPSNGDVDANGMVKPLPSRSPGDDLVSDDTDLAREEESRGSQANTAPADGRSSAESVTTQVLSDDADEARLAPVGDQPSGLRETPKTALESLQERLNCLQNEISQLVIKIKRFESEVAARKHLKPNNFDAKMKIVNQCIGEMSVEMQAVSDEIKAVDAAAKALERQTAATRSSDQNPTEETVRRSMAAYARETRGLSVESLSIHLVPVKASVLSRGVELAFLRQLTLLNVGNQSPIWSLLAKEGRARPLALRSVFTDHVTTAFLSCMAQLPELHDLFLLERSAKHKPESFASRTTTTIDQIRRLVLKRHISTLRRLMIKDETNGPNWDVNEKTMIVICTRGALLQELALSMNIHAVHAFMQYFSGLVNLRAINLLHFKNNDTCIWVMREILRFIVDNLSHHPELKLEWIAMEDERVDRVVRPSEVPGEAREAQSTKRSKGKSKATAHAAGDDAPEGAYPLLPTSGLESESDSDGEDSDSGTRLRFKTVGPLQFYDVWGVKIFEKEIRSGRL